MKRAVAIGITTLFLLQVFAGVRLTDEKDERGEIEVYGEVEGDIDGVEERTRGGGKASLYENGSMGGSWMDDFEDESGVEWKDNVSVEDGKVKLNVWKFKRAINITNNGGALSNYQIQVNLTSQNFDYSKAKSGGEDIRFRYSNGTPLNYWIEKWNDNGDSKIWVNVTNIPNGNSQIWMEYGNPSVESESDGDAVFDLFDDFDGMDLDPNKWGSEGGGAISVLDSKVYITAPSGSASIFSKKDFSFPLVFEGKGRHVESKNIYTGLMETNHETSGDRCLLKYRSGGGGWWSIIQANDGSYTQVNYQNEDENTHIFGIEWISDVSIKYLLDRNILGMPNQNIPDGIPNIPIRLMGINGGKGEWDWVFVRKFTSIEPTTSIRDEHQNPTKATLTSIPIHLPDGLKWSTLSLTKTEPAGTYINVSVLNATNNQTIPGYNNLSDSNIDISNITCESIRLKAYFEGDGKNTPTLDSWGVEWVAENAWRDSFIGNGKVDLENSTVGGLGVDNHTVGLWHFDGNYLDSSGNNNDGTPNGDVHMVGGKYGRGVVFDGDDDYIEVEDNPDLDLTTGGTIALWAKRRGEGYETLVSKNAPSGSNKDYPYYLAYIDGHIHFNLGDGITYQICESNKTITDSAWHYIVLTWNGINVNIYLDGWLDKKITQTTNPHSNGRNLLIGRIRSSSTIHSFNGIIDEVRISDIARTPEEIRAAYEYGKAIRGGHAQLPELGYNPGADPSCVGYWGFDEGSGNTAHDGSGNGNDGTLQNMDDNDWVDGIRGGALEFDGVDEYVDMGDILDMENSFTTTVWAKTTQSSVFRIIQKRGTGTQGRNSGWQLSGSGTLDNTFIDDGNNSVDLYTNASININDDKWHQIALVWDTFTKTGYLYVDSKLDSSNKKGNMNNDLSNNKNLTIGCAWNSEDGQTQFFNGLIDEVAIYNRALTPAEISAHYNFTSARYSTNATLQSTPISLPQYHSWDSLVINKTEPKNHFINVSVIDNTTNQTLIDLNETRGNASVDISSIDFSTHPVIRLNATFEGNGTNTSLLHSWGVNWTNRLPQLGQPTGLASVNRTEPINVSIPASDFEENLTALNFTFEIKHHSDAEWYRPETANIARNLTHVFINATIPAEADIGPHDIRFRLNDSLNATTGWVYPNSSFLIKNNLAVFDGLELSADEVFRTDNITISLLNISDIETDFGSLNITLRHRSHGTQTWYEDYTSTARNRGDEFTFVFEPSKDAALGMYDLKVEIDDDDNITEFISPDRVLVKNNLPVISEDLTSLRLWENTTKIFSLADYGSDKEDEKAGLVWSQNNSTVNTSLIELISIDGDELTIMPVSGAYGSDVIQFNLTDTDGDAVSKDITIEVLQSNEWLAAKLLHPANGINITTTKINLTWTIAATDTNASITSKIYLDENLTKVKNRDKDTLKDSTPDNFFEVIDLKIGKRYYWSVVPYNNTTAGVSVPAFHWFDIEKENVSVNTAPEAELLFPADDTIVKTTSIALKWKGSDKENDTIYYHIYVSPILSDILSLDKTALIKNTKGTTLFLSDLIEKETYYWKVIPTDGVLEGPCISGIWNFTISPSPLNVTLKTAAPKCLEGEKFQFTIAHSTTNSILEFKLNFGDGLFSDWSSSTTASHQFNDPGTYTVSVGLKIDGEFQGDPDSVDVQVIGLDEISLNLSNISEPEKDKPLRISGNITGVDWISENLTLIAEVNGHTVEFTPALTWSGEVPAEYLEYGNNTIIVKLLFEKTEIARKERTMNYNFKESDDEKETGIWKSQWLLFSLIIVALLVILAIGIYFVTKRRKRPEVKIIPKDEKITPKEPEIVETAIEDTTLEDEEDAQTIDREPQLFKLHEAVICQVCLGNIKPGETVYQCGCMNIYHTNCMSRMDECPNCGTIQDMDSLKDDEGPDQPQEIPDDVDVEIEEEIREAHIFVVHQAVVCQICFGNIKPGTEAYQCSCMKIYHPSCIKRVGECPHCSSDVQEVQEEDPDDPEKFSGDIETEETDDTVLPNIVTTADISTPRGCFHLFDMLLAKKGSDMRIGPNSTEEEISRARKNIITLYHPDKWPPQYKDKATFFTQKVNAAWEVLRER